MPIFKPRKELHEMKKMSKNSQLNTNGGYLAYCVACGKTFRSISKKRVRNLATAHWRANGGNSVSVAHRWNWL